MMADIKKPAALLQEAIRNQERHRLRNEPEKLTPKPADSFRTAQ
jgi:hypothetical protein